MVALPWYRNCGAYEFTIVSIIHVLQLCKRMPARCIGCPWRLLYTTFDHGMSLRTLYRKMKNCCDYEESPAFILVRDTEGHVRSDLILTMLNKTWLFKCAYELRTLRLATPGHPFLGSVFNHRQAGPPLRVVLRQITHCSDQDWRKTCKQNPKKCVVHWYGYCVHALELDLVQ